MRLDQATWLPASFVEQVRSFDREEFVQIFGAGMFLLVAINDQADPMLPALAAKSRLLDRLRPRNSIHTALTVQTHSQVAESEIGQEAALVPVPLTKEPRFVVLIEPRDESAEQFTVGRGGSADLVLRHASVSKLHAVFELDRVGALGFTDLGSKNGTCVNGTRLGEGERVDVRSGDELRFGKIDSLLCDPLALWSALSV